MSLHTFTTPVLSINTYLLVDPDTKKGVVVDCTRNVSEIVKKVKDDNINIIAILETHVHADFVSGSKELKYQLGNSPAIFCSGLGGDEWIPSYADFIVEDREEILLGSIRLQAWHTPGHTPEHIMWVIFDDKVNEEIPIQALTGDFLLVGSLGRPDLLGETQVQQLAKQLYHSALTVLPNLPDDLEIYPAHGAGSFCAKSISPKKSSLLGIERENNPFLRKIDEKIWIQNLLKDMPPAPAYFSIMKEVNRVGAPLISELPEIHEIQAEDLIHNIPRNTILIDVRDKADFPAGFIRCSINIGIAGSFLRWVPELIPYDSSVILIGKDQNEIDQAIVGMRLVGLDDIKGYCLLQDSTIKKLHEKLDCFPLLNPQETHQIMLHEKELCIIDVRTDYEWEYGHIPGAHHLQLNNLVKQLDELPVNRTMGTFCGSGYRASIAASILKRHGTKQVFNINGGWQEWQKAQLPIEKDDKKTEKG